MGFDVEIMRNTVKGLLIYAQRRPRSVCAFAQADHGIRCPLTLLMNTTGYIDENGRP